MKVLLAEVNISEGTDQSKITQVKEALLAEKNERIEKDPYIEIIKYKELLDREIITDDEFQLKKKELLNL